MDEDYAPLKVRELVTILSAHDPDADVWTSYDQGCVQPLRAAHIFDLIFRKNKSIFICAEIGDERMDRIRDRFHRPT